MEQDFPAVDAKKSGAAAAAAQAGLRVSVPDSDLDNGPGASVHTPSVMQQFRDAISYKRLLYGQQVYDLPTLFAVMDKDGNGMVTTQELRSALQRLDLGLTLKQIRTLLRTVDKGA